MRKDYTKVFLVSLVCLLMFFAASVSHAAIPDMRGTWQMTVNIVVFENVLKDGVAPVYDRETANIKVTTQKGRVFAGRYLIEGNEEKLTGVIEQDNTVTIQLFDHDGRTFLRGKMSVVDGVMFVRGTITGYEEISTTPDPGMTTGLVTLKKLN
jgi:hypothetical protein